MPVLVSNTYSTHIVQHYVLHKVKYTLLSMSCSSTMLSIIPKDNIQSFNINCMQSMYTENIGLYLRILRYLQQNYLYIYFRTVTKGSREGSDQPSTEFWPHLRKKVNSFLFNATINLQKKH